MLNAIVKAAKSGRLVMQTCIDKATNQQVEVLCVEDGDLLVPIGKIFDTAGDALAEVYPPGGHGVERILH